MPYHYYGILSVYFDVQSLFLFTLMHLHPKNTDTTHSKLYLGPQGLFVT